MKKKNSSESVLGSMKVSGSQLHNPQNSKAAKLNSLEQEGIDARQKEWESQTPIVERVKAMVEEIEAERELERSGISKEKLAELDEIADDLERLIKEYDTHCEETDKWLAEVDAELALENESDEDFARWDKVIKNAERVIKECDQSFEEAERLIKEFDSKDGE